MDILNTHDAPLLGTLLLSFRRYTAREIILRAYTPSKPLFLGHSLEMLRNVAFVDAIVSLECLALFPNLRSLELINSMVWHNTAEFLAFCRTFPRLEELVFIYDRGAASARQYPVTITIDDEKAPARCMPMRGLKKFVHHAPPVHMARTFALLDIPTTATVMLSYDDDRWTHGPVEAALDAPVDGWPGVLANLLDAAPVNGLAGAMIDPLDAFPILQTALHAHFADASGQRFPTLLFDGRELCAAITENDGEASLPSYFHMTIPYIGAQSVETMLGNSPVFLKTPSLIVKPPHPSNRNSIPGLLADEVYHVFRLFSGVARLTLHSYALYRFIEHYKRVGPKPAFPNLESLRIVDMNLAQDINDPDRPRLVMNDLLCALFKPGRVSDWLEYIVFERCTINEADAALLRKGVDTELNVEGAELEFLTCTMVTDEMFAREYKEDE
ncbi:unnamed protein product [Peniophora sp. CBMAI 1063]|nr:unnamed protein product [Peniophora sp. CBMAI 1063]